MEPERQADLEDVVRRFGEQIGASGELKGSTLLRRAKAQALYGSFIRSVTETGSWPVYAIFEKRFWIAGRIVESLFDYVHNGRSSLEFFNDFQAKRDAAWAIARWPIDDLAYFAVAMRSRDAGKMREAVHQFKKLAARAASPLLENLFIGAEENFHTIWRTEFEDKLEYGLDTVNVPAFNSFLGMLDAMASHSDSVTIRLIHDKSREFEDHYHVMFDMLTNMSDFAWPDADGKARFMNVKVVDSFETQDSEESEMLQAADLLANGLFRYTKAVSRGETVPGWLLDALAPTMAFSCTSGTDPVAGRLMGSQEFLTGCYLSVVRGLAPTSTETNPH